MIWHSSTQTIEADANEIATRSPAVRVKLVRSSRAQGGFSLVEMIIVVAIMLTAAAVSIINFPPAMAAMRMNSALNMTAESLRLARSQAFNDRCVYRVDFTLPATLTITQQATGLIVKTFILPPGVNFDAEPGLPSTPATTPDGFGSGTISGPIDFDADFGVGGLNQLFFYPDGSARDSNGHVNNGVVYLAQPGNLGSSRAVSLWGITGRVKKWVLSINQSTGVKSWGQS